MQPTPALRTLAGATHQPHVYVPQSGGAEESRSSSGWTWSLLGDGLSGARGELHLSVGTGGDEVEKS